MLVCFNASLRPGIGIAVNVIEAAAARDTVSRGSAVFTTLVDDPASADDIVIAYLGEIMEEVASAADVVNAGLVYVTSIDEAATAIDHAALPGISVIAEAATAIDALDASKVSGAVTTTSIIGPLLEMDATFGSSMTIIKVGR